jgi:beta-glucosidase
LDLRRTPFSGRNEEYYSEDANVNYYVGAIELSAEQAKGVIAGPKHFCGNDFETARNGISYFYREQAFREGSLRGFEGAMRNDKGGVLAAMSVYGRQGLTYTPACDALNITVLRNEWGFPGHLITDAAVSDYASHFVDQLMGGTAMICFDFDGVSGPALVDYINETDDGNALLQLRETVKNTIYVFSHSAAINGISQDSYVVSITPVWITALNVTIAILTLLTAVFLVLYVRALLIGRKQRAKKEA